MKTVLIITLVSFGVLFSGTAYAGLAAKITEKAQNYKSNMKRVTRNGRSHTQLYGYIIDDELTRYGRWACATVVSSTLKAAGVRIGFKYAVRKIERSLGRWRKIKNASDLRAGDVIIWNKRGHDKKCTGGGDCHVGIALGRGKTFENHVIWGKPGFSRVNKSGWEFKVGLRPPN